MKNKRLAYFLVPLVLLIWGLIAQRIWSAATGDDAGAVPVLARVAATQPTTITRPILLLTYADPFRPLLTTRATRPLPVPAPDQNPATIVLAPRPSVSTQSIKLPGAPAVAATSAPPVVWPQIKYLGLIANSGSNNHIVLLEINAQEVMVKAGAISHGVQLAKAFRDSAQLIFNHQRKIFYRGGAAAPLP